MLDIAIQAAKVGGEIALKHFRHIPKVIYKVDNSPVTKADLEAEKAIRHIIEQHFPDHGIIGEELPNTKENARYQWVIDPIDGTKSFVRGIKEWGVLLAILDDKKPIIGIYNSPATSEFFHAKLKNGAYLNDKKIHVSKVKDLTKGFIVHSSLNHFAKHNKVDALVKMSKAVQGKRGSSDCGGLNMVLKGQADVNISAQGSIWDYAAGALLVEEAGGKFSDFDGNFSLTNDTAIFSNGLVHKQVLNYLNS